MIAAVVIASGFSQRMGRSKLDLELGGRTFLQRAVDAASGAAGVEHCLVVVRPEDESRVLQRTDQQPPPLNPRSVPPGLTADVAPVRAPVETCSGVD